MDDLDILLLTGVLLTNSDVIGYAAHNIQFSSHCFNQVSNLCYCSYCFQSSKNLFGCIGLKIKEFAVLNKVYSENDYFQLREKIVEHMKETGEWGEFFPLSTSPVPYHLSKAFRNYPQRAGACPR